MAKALCRGFQWSGIAAGIKENSKKDLGIIFSERPARAAAVFTRNRVKAAPVLLDAERIKSGTGQAVIVNSGNANCCNGDQGMADAREMTRLLAGELEIDESHILVASTGVIGVPLPIKKVAGAVPGAVKSLSSSGLPDFAESIMTTDRFPKTAEMSGRTELGGTFTICAAAKGAGMIRPDMATMLCFVCTDVAAPAKTLTGALQRATEQSFNRISVDGDTSTNDTVILLANGMSGAELDTDSDARHFQEMLDTVLENLARLMVKDGEGATKLIEICVRGAASPDDARRTAEMVAGSTLVKTAFFGEDANWGRIAAAAGRSGAPFDPQRLGIFFDDVQLVQDGRSGGKKLEAEAAAVLKKNEFRVTIDLNTGGDGRASMLTCDLSLDYVKINSDYRS